MPAARKHQIALSQTPFYHLISRCVRRAFLCGNDPYSGRCYEHRRQWVRARLAELTTSFAIELYAYAIMSNHYHLVVCVNAGVAKTWSDQEVIQRWLSVFAGPELARRYLEEEPLDDQEQETLSALVTVWRERLADISWFMRALNEGIARAANAEDHCKGRFWEGRFKCQALLDQQAIINCMAYVDLNPIRAGMAATPESSDFTSVQQRACEYKGGKSQEGDTLAEDTLPQGALPRLSALVNPAGTNAAVPIPNECPAPSVNIRVEDYLALVDASGRAVRSGKRGSIPEHCLPILERLAMKPQIWRRQLFDKLSFFPRAWGNPVAVSAFASATGRKWVWQG